MHDFFPWLLRTSGQAAVLTVVVLLVQWGLGERLRPRWRYGLWWLVLIRLLLPVPPESALSLFNVRHYALAGLGEFTRYNHGSTERANPPEAQETRWTQKARSGSDVAPAVVAATGRRDSPSALALPEPSVASPSTIPGLEARMARLGRWFPVLWLTGAALFALRLLWQNCRFSRRLRCALPVADARVLRLLADCQQTMSVPTRLVLLETTTVSSPALYGLLRKRLLLPPKLLERFELSELRYVFLHELAHLRRRDMVVSWLMGLLQVLHWFNPLIWLAFKRMGADRELACDELALSVLREGEADAYGQTIIRLLEGFVGPAAVPGLVGILENNNAMEMRIRMIAKFKRADRWSALGGGLLAALALVTLTDAKTADTPQPKGAVRSIAESAASRPAQTMDPAAEQAAIAALEKLGAQIERDEQASGRPVVGVTLLKSEPANEDLRHLRAFPQLGKLLVDGTRISDDGLAHLTVLTNLRELTLSQRSQITDAGMAHLAKMSRLQSLGLDWCRLTDEGVRQIKGLSDLRSLRVVSAIPHTSALSRITDKSCESIKDLSRLESLTIMNGDLSSSGLAHLAGLTNLTLLNLGANPMIGSAGLQHLRELARLKSLYLFGTGVNDEGLKALTGLTELERIDLSGTYVGDEGLAHLKELPRLDNLDLGSMHEPYLSIGGAHVTDAGLVHLGEMVRLKKLWLCGNRITDAGLVHLKPLKQLIWLGLDGTRITDAGLPALQELSSLEALGLGTTRVTDAGLAHLARLPSLRGVGLSDLSITDQGLQHLKSIKQLKEIQIWGLKETQVTQAGLEDLRRSLPALQIDVR